MQLREDFEIGTTPEEFLAGFGVESA